MSMTGSPEQTTLGRSVGSDAFVHQIAAHARKQAELAEQASGGEAGGHVAALHNFADFLTTRGPRDQRIYALWKMAMYSPDSDAYLPGENQASLFGKLGTGVAAPLPESTLNELVAAAVDDLLEAKSAERASLQGERDRAVEKSARADAAEERAAVAETRIERLEAELGAAGETVDSLTAQIEHLRTMVPSGGKTEWKVVEYHPGVYEKQNAAGEITYRIGWRDKEQVQRWKAIGTDLDEAVAARAAIDDEKAMAGA
jgi:hypothetical protein